MLKYNNRPAAGLAALFLCTAPAFAQSIWEEEAWDTDSDGLLSVEEFREGFRERVNFADWDDDGDGVLSEEEFSSGIYGRYDGDLTDAIEATEYGAFERDFGDEGFWRFHGEQVVEARDETEVGDAVTPAEEPAREATGFEAWDVDGDGVILGNEFQTGFQTWGLFAEFDRTGDGSVTEDELTQEIFDRYDDNGDGMIEEPELADIGDDMGDGGFWDA
ncbi:hypothetical protein [Paracoccus aerius]|uniref:EF-hand domain-containing protein n=1 Tax=Paracoccus aerius TaxID=1915382 RepID=A0ABS1SE41_9RHOB|nr:hypothetical protein [Paracoccus aerius]MBL3675776.1 hypothetical protein [Paracoccus aerius]GHG37165.1 hypothetical protein GCM10017322_39930 [Paracoccus aerius]